MPAQSEFRREVEKQRAYLVRYATLQLRDPEAVQDVVQGTASAITLRDVFKNLFLKDFFVG